MNSSFDKNFPDPHQSMHSKDNYLEEKSSGNRGYKALVVGVLSSIFLTLFFVWSGIQQYNEVQQLSERVSTDLDHVVNQYMRRADLIPKLSRAIESFSNHEKELINSINKSQLLVDKLTNGASPSANAASMNAFMKAQREIDLAISQLMASFRKAVSSTKCNTVKRFVKHL